MAGRKPGSPECPHSRTQGAGAATLCSSSGRCAPSWLRDRGARGAADKFCPPGALVEGNPDPVHAREREPCLHLAPEQSQLPPWNLCNTFMQPSQILSGYLCPSTELGRRVGKCSCARRAPWS